MQFFVLTSGGEVLQTDSQEQYVSWLDEYGPEVESSCAKTEEEAVQAGLVWNPAVWEAAWKPSPTDKQVAYVNAAIDLLPAATLRPAMYKKSGSMLLIIEEAAGSRYGRIDPNGKLVGGWF